MEKVCPYCKGAGFQMLATRAAEPGDKGSSVLIEQVYCWKCRGTGKVTELTM